MQEERKWGTIIVKVLCGVWKEFKNTTFFTVFLGLYIKENTK